MKVKKVGSWLWYGTAVLIGFGGFSADIVPESDVVIVTLLCILIARSYDK